MLETGDVPVLFSLPQMQNLGITLELDPERAKITCPAFGLYSSPVEYCTMGPMVLDLTSRAYQPKSRERSVRPTKHASFVLSQRKPAYLAHTQELDDDEDDKPVVRPDSTTVSGKEDEDDKPLVQLTSVLNRESSATRSVLSPLRRRKGPPVWQDAESVEVVVAVDSFTSITQMVFGRYGPETCGTPDGAPD